MKGGKRVLAAVRSDVRQAGGGAESRLQDPRRSYVHRFHAQRKAKLQLLLDAGEVACCRGTSGDTDSREVKSLPGSPVPATGNGPPTPTFERRSPAAAALRVGSQDYLTVGTALILVSLVGEYCVCAFDLPALASVIAKNLSDLLRTFNSKSCQLVRSPARTSRWRRAACSWCCGWCHTFARTSALWWPRRH
nr:unnamed protein product [Callosobruchus chinensis]